jgi:pyruvate formate lyase activating enzyme
MSELYSQSNWYKKSVRPAALLNRQASILREIGGVTFSGDEPLAQAGFLSEVIEQLCGLHIVLDTSGYAEQAAFQCVAAKCNLVHYDLKLIDCAMHQRYTGCDNAPILANLRRLSEMGVLLSCASLLFPV